MPFFIIIEVFDSFSVHLKFILLYVISLTLLFDQSQKNLLGLPFTVPSQRYC